MNVVVYEDAGFLKAGNSTHGHATAVLNSVCLCGRTTTYQSHPAATMLPLRNRRRIRQGRLYD